MYIIIYTGVKKRVVSNQCQVRGYLSSFIPAQVELISTFSKRLISKKIT